LYHALGDVTFADRAERAAFNALPAAVMGDWWAHQYASQPNQPYAKLLSDKPFWNVNNKGTTFGQEPNYPCCTVNHPQGYPKFLAASWVKVGNDGLGHVFLLPSALETTLDNGVKVNVEVKTNYPFGDALFYTVSSSGPFKLHIRIPSWVEQSSSAFKVNEENRQGVATDERTGLLEISLPHGESAVNIYLHRTLKTEFQMNNSVAIMHGPLLYSLDVGYYAKSSFPQDFTDRDPLTEKVPSSARDWAITNTKPWYMAIDIESLVPKSSPDISTMVLPNPIWERDAPPTYMEGEGCEILWPMFRGVPGPVPTTKICLGNRTKVRFVPVGSAKIGMTVLPVL
jgi:DUF1680 family protein